MFMHYQDKYQIAHSINKEKIRKKYTLLAVRKWHGLFSLIEIWDMFKKQPLSPKMNMKVKNSEHLLSIKYEPLIELSIFKDIEVWIITIQFHRWEKLMLRDDG